MGSEQTVQVERGLPGAVRGIVLALCTAVLLSALAGAALALLQPLLAEGHRAAPALFGFEVVVVVAAGLGVLISRGRFMEAPGMALLCVGGTIFAASVLGWQSAGRQLAGFSLTPAMGLRVLAGFALMGLAGVSVLQREPRSWKPALVGAALGLPVLAACAVIVLPRGRGLVQSAVGDDVMVQAGAAILALVVFGGLLAASVQLVVGAFDRAVGD